MEEVKVVEETKEQYGDDLFDFQLSKPMIKVKTKLANMFVSGDMPHDWQIYAAHQLVNKQCILNIPTGYGKSHVLSTAAYILASKGEYVTLLYQSELIKNRDQDKFSYLLKLKKDGQPLVRFEAIWGTDDDGHSCLNLIHDIFTNRVLIDEIDVTFLDQPEFRDRIMESSSNISGVTASATADDETSVSE